MDYNETIAYIHNTPKFARELGNTLLRKLLDNLGNPQKELKFIHIAGTNGKGSTAVMIAEILQKAGYKVGLFTSPYIEVFNERIKINGEYIPNDTLARIITKIKDVIEINDTPVSEFALDTAAAFCYFKEEKCDIVVLETGMGGRLDATNVIDENLVTVLTSISLDHTQYLGETITEIAEEKCGIFKEACPVVCYPKLSASAIEVIEKTAAEMNTKLYFAEKPELTVDGILYKNKQYTLGLKGDFQAFNAATVLETINVLRNNEMKIPDKAIEEGLKNASHLARFEYFGNRIILDGGHNQDAMEELVKSLKGLNKPIYLCIAMMEDKNYDKCVDIISNIINFAVITEIDMPRCCPAEKLASVFESNNISTEVIPNPEKALEKAVNLAGENGIVCICGSLYLAGKIRPFLKRNIHKFT